MEEGDAVGRYPNTGKVQVGKTPTAAPLARRVFQLCWGREGQ